MNGSDLNGTVLPRDPPAEDTPRRPPWVTYTLASILIFTIVVDLLGNLLVILSVYRNKKLRNAGKGRRGGGGGIRRGRGFPGLRGEAPWPLRLPVKLCPGAQLPGWARFATIPRRRSRAVTDAKGLHRSYRVGDGAGKGIFSARHRIAVLFLALDSSHLAEKNGK